MTSPTLVGIYAPAMGCGKSTVAEHLGAAYGYTPLKFADTLKSMLAVFLEDLGLESGEVERRLHGDLKEAVLPIPNARVTARNLMQTLGTEWGREYVDPGIWPHILRRRADSYIKSGMRVVVDDLRFPQEYAALKDAGAYLIRIDRPGRSATNNHSSEGRLDGVAFDANISNDRDLAHLRSQVESVMSKFLA